MSEIDKGNKLHVNLSDGSLGISMGSNASTVGWLCQSVSRNVSYYTGSTDSSCNKVVESIKTLINSSESIINNEIPMDPESKSLLKKNMVIASIKLETMAYTSYNNEKEKLNNFLLLSSEIKKVANTIFLEEEENKIDDSEFLLVEKTDIENKIEEEVKQFLAPYLSDELSQKTEPTNKERLMPILLEKYGQEVGKEKLQEIALRAYIDTATWGFLVPISIEATQNSKSVNEKQEIIKLTLPKYLPVLVKALKEGIAKDFPDLTLSSNELNNFISSIVNKLPANYSIYKMISQTEIQNIKKENNNRISTLQKSEKAPIWKTKAEVIKSLKDQGIYTPKPKEKPESTWLI